MNWRIYYDDGTTFDDTMGKPHEAPPLGFVMAIGYDECGVRYIMREWDHYCFDKDANQWWGCDRDGWLDRSLHGKMYAHKLGRTVTKSAYQEMYNQVKNDPDFPMVLKETR